MPAPDLVDTYINARFAPTIALYGDLPEFVRAYFRRQYEDVVNKEARG